MKKITSILFFVFLIAQTAMGQVPMHYNSNTTGGGNTFPFNNSATSRKLQWFIPPNSLVNPTPVGPGNNITAVYIHANTSATRLYPNLVVKLKQGSGTGLTGFLGGPVEPGMATVYAGSNINIVATAGGWMQFVLQTPFLYDPTFPLIVEIEHDATTGTGPNVNQPFVIPGPGAGRQWANYQAATLTGTATSLVNFGIDVLPATPCTVTPGANTVITPTAPVCPFSSANLSLATTYSFGGITYQWYSSTLSAVGPFTNAIANGTAAALTTPTLSQTTWFTVVATCTNVAGSTTATAGQLNVSGIVTDTVPYYEGFESITGANKLPNCSWAASNMPATCQTYTALNTNNRIPRTGTKFAAFYYNPANTNYFYTNGIYLNAGVTYSAAMWYTTEALNYTNWTDLSILYNTAQTAVGATTIASTNGLAISPIYTSLSNTFTVPSSGLYYIAVRGTGNTSSSAQYLSWDDLSITVPCNAGSPNVPNVTANSNTATVCQYAPLNLSANGADTYTWSNGANASAITVNPYTTGNNTFTVTGTSTLTGCSSTAVHNVFVNPTPVVSAYAVPFNVCPGNQAVIYATGALSYTWNNNATTPSTTVTPSSSLNTFSVIGANSFGCSSQAVQVLTMLPSPTIVVTSNKPDVACVEDMIILNASGAATYNWISGSTNIVYFGTTVNAFLNTTTVFTLTGTGTNGCSTTTTITQSISECVGVNKVTSTLGGTKVYPNPSTGEFIVELNSNSEKTFEITDLTGRIVSSSVSKEEKMHMNIKTLSKGVYYLKITSNETVEVIKLVKD